jgi:hypothetical protein
MKIRSAKRALAAGSIAALALLALPAAALAGTIGASPPTSNFNTQPWFFGSQFNSFTISNSGSDTTLGAATITGPDAARFFFNNDGCAGATLSDTGSCNIGVVFNPPNGPGSFTAQLNVPSDGSPNPLVIPLSVEVLAGPDFVSSPPRVAFGDTVLGTTSSQLVRITNTGDSEGGVQQAFIVGPQEFEIENDGCTLQLLEPGDDCTLTAVFAPSVPGDYQGSIFAIVATGNEPVLPIGLSGKGRLAPGPAPKAKITGRPKAKTTSTTAGFQFTSKSGVSFECKLDKEAFAPCNSPSTYVVKRGKHTFKVRARNADGVAGKPAKAKWTVGKAGP